MEPRAILDKEVSIPKFPADFEAQLRFLTPEEGGRRGPVYQGYRLDFRYARDVNELWMVRPVFLDEDGAVIPGDAPIIGNVRALMYIVLDEMRKAVHRQRLHVGVKFSLHEGLHVVAEGNVARIIALYEDR